VLTRDAKLLFHAYDELEVGGVVAGDVPTFRLDHMPYGGVKDSGWAARACVTPSRRWPSKKSSWST
jgi:acyl-CoA reductase-like NAD-dependent aldehyde dehydrogenase